MWMLLEAIKRIKSSREQMWRDDRRKPRTDRLL